MCAIFTGAFLVFCSGQTDLSGLHSGFLLGDIRYFVTPLVSAILSATRDHELDVCGSTVYEYREKGRSHVRIFFQRLTEIWNPIKTSEGLLMRCTHCSHPLLGPPVLRQKNFTPHCVSSARCISVCNFVMEEVVETSRNA